MRMLLTVIPNNEDPPSWMVKQLLEQAGYSIDDVCKDLKVTTSNVWNCLYGAKNKRVQGRIAEILRMEPEYIWPSRYQTEKSV